LKQNMGKYYPLVDLIDTIEHFAKWKWKKCIFFYITLF